MPSFKNILLSVVIGGIGLLYISNRLIETHAFPSLAEFQAQHAASSTPTKTVEVQAPRGIIHAALSDTEMTRSRGLSGYASLAPDAGMLFSFPVAGSYGFWMKDMNFPIDMIWINASSTVVGIARNVATSTYPDTFLPPSPILYVLEVNAGGAQQWGIATGTVLRF